MIDPKEVRVGNWVIKITGKDFNTQSFFEYRAIAVDEYYYTFAKNCFPIRITPAVLGKCGFTHGSGDWYINKPNEGIDNGLPFLRFNYADSCWYLEKMKLWSKPLYVHQLQNLYYALTKEELKIGLGHFANIDMMGPINFFVKPILKSQLSREMM
jgi:hypothetical protein